MKKVFGAIILVLWIIAVPCYLVYSVQAILSGNLQAEEIVLILVVCLILYFMLILICRIRGVFSSIFRGGWGTVICIVLSPVILAIAGCFRAYSGERDDCLRRTIEEHFSERGAFLQNRPSFSFLFYKRILTNFPQKGIIVYSATARGRMRRSAEYGAGVHSYGKRKPHSQRDSRGRDEL